MKKLRIAICIPSRDLWKARFGMSLCKMFAMSLLNSNHDISVMNEKGSTVARNRNKLVYAAAKEDCTHILFLDDDMTFPHDALLRLLKHDRDVCGCNYPKKHEAREPTCKGLDGRWVVSSSSNKGLESVRYLGGGCLLIKMDVFVKLKFPYFMEDTENGYGEDAYFCAKAIEAGFEIFCDNDLSKEIGHLGDKEFKFNA